MKKGVLGTLALIFGIIIFVSNTISPIVSGNLYLSFLSKLVKIPLIMGYVPTVVISIIAIAKNSNRKGAIIGLILASIAWFTPIVIRIIFNI